jgi:hypothetical protein
MKARLLTPIALIVFLFASCRQSDEMDSPVYRPEAEIMNMERPEGSYDYPVYPGTEAWAELSTGEEMLEACQIPENVLKAMSTQAVIQALWEHPLLTDVFHRDQYRRDFDSMFSSNHAYRELCAREDAGISLLERMKAVNPLYSVPEARFKFELLEMLAAQDVFLSLLTVEDKVLLVKIALEKDDVRQKNAAFANKPERAVTWLLTGQTMLNAGYRPFVAKVNGNEALKLFFTSDLYVYSNEVYGNIPQIITEYAIEFMRTSKI